VLLIAVVLLAVLSVPLTGGRIERLAELRFRRIWLVAGAVALQVALFTAFRGPDNEFRAVAYLVSYVLGMAFVISNRRVSGLWLIWAGAGLNLLALAANGGVMPAHPSTLAAAGFLPRLTEVFSNSQPLPSPHLAFLGDIFAVPASWPLHNVFSIGDVCVALGVVVTIHVAAGSRLFPSGRGQFAPLLRHPDFMRVWGSQAVSNMGDWMYALAVGASVAQRTHSVHVLAFLLIAQSAPAALFSLLLGPLADRYSRRALMVGADVARGVAVLSLLIGGPPSMGHLYLVAGCLGLFGAVFQPSLQASVPNLVPEREVVAANAMVEATFHLSIMAGPALGGFLMAKFGAGPVFAINAASFAISAVLLIGIRLPRPDGVGSLREHGRQLVEGLRYAAATPLVRGILMVTGLVMLGAATKAPLESLFVLGTLSQGVQALGLVGGTWGVGMLLGSLAAPAMARRWPRERLLAASIALVGTAIVAASQAHALSSVLLAWVLAGAGNAVGNVSYASLLQERTPDAMRGRVFAASEAVLEGTYLAGALLASWIGGQLGIRWAYAVAGGLMLLAAVLARTILRVPARPSSDPLPRPVRGASAPELAAS
jgi:MFS family permease